MFDEISLEYWKNNKEKGNSSKDYTCLHNGFKYGDNMENKSVEFVYVNDGKEMVCKGRNNGSKWAYFELIEKACQQSNVTLTNFLNTKSEKFRLYTEDQVELFTDEKIKSTRIKNGAGKIIINNTVYYAAHNLKVCEYFNNAADCIDPAELSKWFIRINFTEDSAKSMVDLDENEVIEEKLPDKVSLTVHLPKDISVAKQQKKEKSKIYNIDYSKLNESNKKIGDMGEEVVIMYETQRLIDAGHSDYSKQIEHSSVTIGDGLGYDIVSYQEDGTKFYIEVKTTKHNKPADFYLSKNEKSVADNKCNQGEIYKIYRVYNLNILKGTGDLVIYEPPFTKEKYSMEPENWKINPI